MKWLKIFAAAVTLFLVFLGSALAVNQQVLTLKFAVWETPFALSMFWWLLAAFLIGLFFGLLNAAWVNVKHRLEIRTLRRQLDKVEAAIEPSTTT